MPRPKAFDENAALERATDAFWSRSYAAITTNDLCEATGLSRSSLYNTFTSKGELFQRCLADYCTTMSEAREPYREHPGSGREALEEFLLSVVALQHEDAEHRVCLSLHAAVDVGSTDPAIGRLTHRNLDDFRSLLTDLISRGQRDGSVTADGSPSDLAQVVHAAIDGLQVAGRVHGDAQKSRRGVRTLLTLLNP